MVFEQSRAQNIINKMYLWGGRYLIFAIPAVVVGLFYQDDISHIKYFFIALVVIFLVTTLWLLIFNSDKSRVIEYGLIFDDKGVCYVEYGSKKTLEWHQCEGVVVTSARDYPRVITIKSKNKDDIAFGYYVFSRKQREAIFRHISAFLPS